MVLKLSRMSFDNLFQRFTALEFNGGKCMYYLVIVMQQLVSSVVYKKSLYKKTFRLLTLTSWVFLIESILNPPKSTNFVTHKMLVS